MTTHAYTERPEHNKISNHAGTTTISNQVSNPNDPPPLHPLDLIDDFLSSLPTPSYNHDQQKDHTTLDGKQPQNHNNTTVILRAAEFLYGGYGSLLESSLAVLDSSFSSTTTNTGRQTTSPITPPAVRRIKAHPSGRIMYLVRGGTTKYGGVTHYYCLLRNNSHGRRQQQQQQRKRYQTNKYYCNCRSFYELTKKQTTITKQRTPNKALSSQHETSGFDPNGGNSGGNRSNNVVLCKHLLAIKLAPYLNHHDSNSCFGEEEVSEDAFADYMVQYSI